jgi:hypothetical protein
MDDTWSFFTEIRAVAGGREDQFRPVRVVFDDTAHRLHELIGLHENLEIEDDRMEAEVFALFVDASRRLDALEALDAEGGTTSADDETVHQSEAAFADYLDTVARRCSGLLSRGLEALDAEGGTTSADETVYQSEAAFTDYLNRLGRAWRRCSGLLRSDELGKSQR